MKYHIIRMICMNACCKISSVIQAHPGRFRCHGGLGFIRRDEVSGMGREPPSEPATQQYDHTTNVGCPFFYLLAPRLCCRESKNCAVWSPVPSSFGSSELQKFWSQVSNSWAFSPQATD